MTRRRSAVLGTALVLVLAVSGGALGFGQAASSRTATPRATGNVVVQSVDDSALDRIGASGDPATRVSWLGATAGQVIADVTQFLTAVASAPDPQWAASQPASSPSVGAAPDRCATAAAARPPGCPAGIAGRVIDVDIPRIVSVSDGTARCPSVTGSPGFSLAVVTTVQAPVRVDYGPSRSPATSVTASTGTPTLEGRVLTCIELGGLLPDTPYEARVSVGDDQRWVPFDSGGGSVRPPAVFFAATDDLIVVTVPHRPREEVVVTPVLHRVTGEDCGGGRALDPIATVNTSLPPNELTTSGYDEAYADRTAVGFAVDEGTTVLLCVEVRDAAGQPTYRARAIVATADRLVPVLRIEHFSGSWVPDWNLTAFLPGGQNCGSWSPAGLLPGENIDLDYPDPELLCDSGGAGTLPFSGGDPSFMTVQFTDPRYRRSGASLNLGPASLCRGDCRPPPDTHFEVAGADASVRLVLSWEHGYRTGVAVTTVVPIGDGRVIPMPQPPVEARTGVPVEIGFELRDTTAPASVGSLFITMRADGMPLLGPRAGGCYAGSPSVSGSSLTEVALAGTTRISGTVTSVRDTGDCIPLWSSTEAVVSFTFDVRLDDLLAAPDGLSVHVEPEGGGGVEATVTLAVRR